MVKNSILILFILLCGILLHAQEIKQEREVYIDRSEMPVAILGLLDSLVPNASKIKYLQETDGEHESYEVKFVFKHRKYSVEFSKGLVLEDVEKDIQYRTLYQGLKQRIDSTFQTNQKYRIHNIQKQYSAQGQSDMQVIQAAIDDSEDVTIRYELEVSLKIDDHWEDAEILFDANGYFLSKRKIIKRESDFIDYR